MTENQSIDQPTLTGWRYWLGLFFFVFAWICPLFIPVVMALGFSEETKTMLSGFLMIGAPEILSIVSIVFLGKPGFEYLKSKLISAIRIALPRSKVSRMRYRIGLFLLVLNIVFAYLIFYVPEWIPGYAENRIPINLAADFLFIVTLFILGGDFWDKLRALFIYEAKAYIPEKE